MSGLWRVVLVDWMVFTVVLFTKKVLLVDSIGLVDSLLLNVKELNVGPSLEGRTLSLPGLIAGEGFRSLVAKRCIFSAIPSGIVVSFSCMRGGTVSQKVWIAAVEKVCWMLNFLFLWEKGKGCSGFSLFLSPGISWGPLWCVRKVAE